MSQRDRFAALFLLELTTGIRRGQNCGLKWSAVDLDTGEVTVPDNRVVVGGRARDKPGGKTHNADKTISVDPATAPIAAIAPRFVPKSAHNNGTYGAGLQPRG